MSRRHAWIVGALGTLGLLVGLTSWSVVHEPRFYRAAREVDITQQRVANDEMLATVAALVSTVRHTGPWSVEVTEAEINGWLAVDLVENYPQLLPAGLTEPRVRIKPEGVTVAARYQLGPVEPIVSLEFQPTLRAPNVLVLRIDRTRAGAIPLPTEQLLDTLTRTAAAWGARIEWSKQNGDPLAIVTLPPLKTSSEVITRVETLDIVEGSITLRGQSQPLEATAGRVQRGENVANQR